MVMTHYRRISLCNVLYKMVSTVSVNCLKKVINLVIDEAKRAFLPDRLITNNAI